LEFTPGTHKIHIYSDDSVYTGCYRDGRRYAHNVDISSCDSGNGAGIFAIVHRAMAKFDPVYADALIKQCRERIIINNPDAEAEVMKIKFEGPFEGSGSVLTTILNHFASLLIALSFSALTPAQEAPIRDSIITAAFLAGHVVTCSDDYCNRPEKLQFLKYSPAVSPSGGYILIRNYGCLFRNLGRVKGDLSHVQLGVSHGMFKTMSSTECGNLFISNVVAGYKNEPPSRLLNALRSRFTTNTTSVELDYRIIDDHPRQEVDELSVLSRYDLSPGDVEQLAIEIENFMVGDVIVSPILTRIYAVDYEL
jgi:hypothetical protein